MSESSTPVEVGVGVAVENPNSEAISSKLGRGQVGGWVAVVDEFSTAFRLAKAVREVEAT